ncbi:hypothetical protein [Microbacterium sp. A1-JK]|uniref:hypothetical protein n=1 Tax=Microbacterium sp. A1-JK TaxID=3177516 RepID=UPI0038839ED2
MSTPTPADVAALTAPRTFTQGEVDGIIKDRADRIARQQHAEYEDVRAQAQRAEQAQARIAEIEAQLEAGTPTGTAVPIPDARPADAEFIVQLMEERGLAPEDRILLSGADEATVTMQAERLRAMHLVEGNVAPREGFTRTTGRSMDREMREFLDALQSSNGTY